MITSMYDSDGKEIESQLLHVVNASIAIRNYYVTAYMGKLPSSTPKYWLAFTASAPPLGFSTCVVSTTKKPGASFSRQRLYTSAENGNDSIEVVIIINFCCLVLWTLC